MAPTKLSDSDKQEILNLYRQPGETTSTLAERYSVSNTTISRILKNSLPEKEYEQLVQQKRSAGKSAAVSTPAPPEPQSETPAPLEPQSETLAPSPIAAPILKKKSADEKPVRRQERPSSKQNSSEEEDTQLPLLESDFETAAPAKAAPSKAVQPATDRRTDFEDDEDEDDADLLDEDIYIPGEDADFEDDEDEDDLDDDELDEDDSLPPVLGKQNFVEILPLSTASLPKPCYLVVDRAAELITRPLREFGHLGQIPDEENTERTLPIFDNHRVARRFSRKNQRVVKVPDGRMLEKTSEYLHAKGITRLLIDGQVYSVLN